MLNRITSVLFIAIFAISVNAEERSEPSAIEVITLIETNGKIHFAEATANLKLASARLQKAWGKLLPKLSATIEAQRYNSSHSLLKDRAEVTSGLELVQPIFDFGHSWLLISAAEADQKSEIHLSNIARRTVLLEGLALFYDLHASELYLQAFEEAHASQYVQWERAKERESIGMLSKVDVATKLYKTENSRLALYKERTRNLDLRLRLTELTSYSFESEMIIAPKISGVKLANINLARIRELAIINSSLLEALKSKEAALTFRRQGSYPFPRFEAFSSINQYSRASTGRNNWTAGGRIIWNIFDKNLKSAQRLQLSAELGRINAQIEIERQKLGRQLEIAVRRRYDAWQEIITSRSRFDLAKYKLLQRQQMYDQGRISKLGVAMTEFTTAEAELVKSIGNFYVGNANLAVLLGEEPSLGLDIQFPNNLIAGSSISDDDYEPKRGSGYGQEDQNILNRKVE